MAHRPQFQYTIRDREDRLLMSVFTDIRSCRLPMHVETHVDLVVGTHVIRISRQEAARILRNARHDDEFRRIVREYDTSEFCDKYCVVPS